MNEGEGLREAEVYDGSLPARFKPAPGGLLLRGTVLVAGALVALAMVIVPLVDRSGSTQLASGGPDLDMMFTGSIDAPRQYVIRRSVLQAPGSPPCILFADGASRGGC
ncbi:hypothetical protein E3C22_22045 [Jiella endophytica]|uniref:Uncharacterized protein n=1 Tax=Jiella endophytica TaxID=2558362 RepID=A0A4Y8RAE6_9HYPH|nr:hypothetical protein [Jiella endophytica]TFF18238.1 hypothetical protein E3C22_22045 [Jiella endophytica]